MALLALSDLLARLTRDEVLDSLLSIASSVGLNVTAWQSGQPGRTLLVTVAQKIADLTETTYEIAAGGLLEYATAGWLTLLARSHFNVERRAAEYATGVVTLTNASGGSLGPWNPGDLVFAHNVTGKTYRNTALVPIIADATTADVDVMADESGTDSDAAPTAIDSLVTTILGLTVSNAAAVLGADEETDEDLRERCREKLGSLSPNGPAEAYSTIAKQAETSSPITRTHVVNDPTTGEVTVYVATASGAPTGGDVTIVQEAIDQYATPLCVTATAEGAVELTVPITGTVTLYGTSLTEAEIEAEIETALAVYFASLEVGGQPLERVDIDAIKATIFAATAGVKDVSLSLPAADPAVDENEVPKLGTVTLTITVL